MAEEAVVGLLRLAEMAHQVWEALAETGLPHLFLVLQLPTLVEVVALVIIKQQLHRAVLEVADHQLVETMLALRGLLILVVVVALADLVVDTLQVAQADQVLFFSNTQYLYLP
jgi:hypothetical protein